jgi:hypothetical protein
MAGAILPLPICYHDMHMVQLYLYHSRILLRELRGKKKKKKKSEQAASGIRSYSECPKGKVKFLITQARCWGRKLTHSLPAI